MPRTPEIDCLAAWSKGVPLQSADVHFALPAQRQAYQAFAPRSSGLTAVMNAIAEALNQTEAIPSGQRITAQERAVHLELGESMQAALVYNVTKGHLKAFGFAYPRRPDDKPCEVPTDLWNHSVGWSTGRLEGNGLRIEAVRICHPKWLVTAVKDQSPAPTQPMKKRGRPSNRPLILEAYGQCKKEGKIDFAGKKKDAVAVVRAWLKANRLQEFKQGDNFGARLIEKLISDDFDRERAAQPPDKE